MKRDVRMAKALLLAIMLVICANSVLSLGVAPASKVIKFEPFLEEEHKMMIVSNPNTKVAIAKEGELKDYIRLEKDMVEFGGDTERFVNVTISLPESLAAGDHTGEIVIAEIPQRKIDPGISAALSVISRLIVRVPYVGKFAKAELNLAEVGGDIHISIPISNMGTEEITARAKVEISSEDIEIFETDSITIRSLEKGWINAVWTAPSVGVYDVAVSVYYADKVIELQGKAEVGEPFVKVEDVFFDEIRIGKTVGFDILAKSGWNKIIKDVYADVWIRDAKGGSIAKLRTASTDIAPLVEKNLTAYWDTKGITAGAYDFAVRLNYANKKSDKVIKVNVSDILITKPVSSYKEIIIVAIIVIILLLLVIWNMIRKKPKKRRKHRPS